MNSARWESVDEHPDKLVQGRIQSNFSIDHNSDIMDLISIDSNVAAWSGRYPLESFKAKNCKQKTPDLNVSGADKKS